MARNQECQDKVRSEVNAIFNTTGRPTYDDLESLQYLSMCIKETLRIFPPIMYSTKVCTKSYELINKGARSLEVPVGCEVIIPTYAIHHDPNFYPDPEKFNPERFNESSPEAKTIAEQGLFIPFGAGLRMCPAIKYAEAIIKAAVVEIIHHFDVQLDPHTRDDNQIDEKSNVACLKNHVVLNFTLLKQEEVVESSDP